MLRYKQSVLRTLIISQDCRRHPTHTLRQCRSTGGAKRAWNRGGPARDCRDGRRQRKRLHHQVLGPSVRFTRLSLSHPPDGPALHHILACSTTYSQLTACYPILHLPPTTLDRDSPSSGLSSSSGSPYHSPPPSPLVTRFAHPFTGQHLLPWCALIL